MSKVLKRKLFRHKYQTTTNQVPGYRAGAFLDTLRTLANVATPYTQGARMFAQPLMQRGVQFGQKVAESPAGKLAGRGIKRLGENRFVRGLGNVISAAAPIGAVGYGAKTLYDLGQSGVAASRGDFDQAKTELGEAADSAITAAYNIPFVRKGAQLYSKAGKYLGLPGEGRGLRRLAQTVTPKFTKSFLGGAGFEAGLVGADAALPDYEPNLFEEKPRAHNLFPPTPEDEAKLDGTNNNVLTQQTGETTETDRQAVVGEGEQSAVEKNASSEQELANPNVLGRDVLTASRDERNKNVVLREENPKLYEDIMAGKDGALTKEMQNQFDEQYADANAQTYSKRTDPYSTVQTDLTTLGNELQKAEYDNSKAMALVDKYAKTIDDKKKQSFEEYRKRYQEMTGDDGTNNYRDLAMFKWAMRMMSGKTTQTGMGGFFDILGRSSSALADDILAIDQSEKAQRRALADRYMNYEALFDQQKDQQLYNIFTQKLGLIQNVQEKKFLSDQDMIDKMFEINKLQIEARTDAAKLQNEAFKNYFKVGDGTTYKLPDANVFGGERMITLYQNDQKVPMFFNPAKGKLEPFMINGKLADIDKLSKVEYNATKLAEIFDQMKSIDEAMRYSDQFKKITSEEGFGDGIIGLSGSVELLLENLGDVLTQLPVAGPSLAKFLGHSELSSMMVGGDNSAFKQQLAKISDPKEAAEILKRYDDDIGRVTNRSYVLKVAKDRGIAADDEAKLAALSQLLIIEQRMKYNVAHANKAGDRLAVSDIKSAEGRTQIFTIFKSRRIIKKNYENFGIEMTGTFAKQFDKWKQFGGDPNAIARAFHDNAFVKALLAEQDMKIEQVGTEEEILERLKQQGLLR
tara:strand:- start:442 stop:3015 length:2574 start_codon:yes stop_codon:yes gene_type:complete